MENSPYGDGPYATIFLGYGNQPSTKEVWSEVCSGMNWWLAAILLHSLQMALTASEFICLMMPTSTLVHLLLSSALHFDIDHLKSAEVKGVCMG